MSKPSKENRKSRRIYHNFIVSYCSASDASKQKNVTQINNISMGGMNFSVSETLKDQELLTIELKTPFLPENLHLQGQVLECREKISGLIYEVRVKFKDLSVQAQEGLVKIEQYAQKEK